MTTTTTRRWWWRHCEEKVVDCQQNCLLYRRRPFPLESPKELVMPFCLFKGLLSKIDDRHVSVREVSAMASTNYSILRSDLEWVDGRSRLSVSRLVMGRPAWPIARKFNALSVQSHEQISNCAILLFRLRRWRATNPIIWLRRMSKPNLRVALACRVNDWVFRVTSYKILGVKWMIC